MSYILPAEPSNAGSALGWQPSKIGFPINSVDSSQRRGRSGLSWRSGKFRQHRRDLHPTEVPKSPAAHKREARPDLWASCPARGVAASEELSVTDPTSKVHQCCRDKALFPHTILGWKGIFTLHKQKHTLPALKVKRATGAFRQA